MVVAIGVGDDQVVVVSWLQTNKTGYSPVNAFSLQPVVASVGGRLVYVCPVGVEGGGQLRGGFIFICVCFGQFIA